MKTKPITEKVGNVCVKIYTQTRPYKDGSRTTYLLADATTGVRKLRGFSNLTEARKEAKRIAGQIASGQTEAAQMSNADAASFGRAVELLRPVGISLELAAEKYAKAFQLLGSDSMLDAVNFYAKHRGDKIIKKTVAETVSEFLAAKEARDKSDRYVADLRTRLNRFAGDFVDDISAVTGPRVQAWLDRLAVAPQTAKNFRTVLSTFFSFAESRGYILKGSNPIEDTESIEVRNDGAITIFNPEEMAKLISAAPSEFLPVLVIGAFAGLRSAEIERLEWTDVDMDGCWIHVSAENSKTGSRRLVPILPNLLRWLIPMAKNGHVWQGTAQTIRDRRADTCEKAGVPWKENALRHSFISYRLADIQNAAQVALEAGNSAQMVFKHYRELVRPDAAKAWFSIAP